MKKKIPYIIVVCLIIILIIIFSIPKEKEYTKDFFYMDTVITIKVYTKDKKIEKKLEEIDKLFLEYHNLTSAYEEIEGVNNIYYINEKLPLNTKCEIDAKLFELLELGIKTYEDTEGKVNIASFNLTNLWKTYIDKKEGVPSIEELQANSNVNISDLVLEENTIMKKSDIKLDLGAITKGFVTEKVGKLLEENGLSKYLINAGGNVKVGSHYENDKYKIGLENPLNPEELYRILKVENKSIVSSGNYQRYYEYEGEIYHHLIDLDTLYPANYMKSVTVITNDSSYGDILSSYLFLMPYEKGIEVVNNLNDVEVIWYLNDGTVKTSKGFYHYE